MENSKKVHSELFPVVTYLSMVSIIIWLTIISIKYNQERDIHYVHMDLIRTHELLGDKLYSLEREVNERLYDLQIQQLQNATFDLRNRIKKLEALNKQEN